MLSAALDSLPHGSEFRFVDELIALDPGKSASGRYLIKGTEAFLPGHFPGQPIMPAVILIEAVAQVAGIAAQTDPVHGRLANLRLTAVRGVKILSAAVPGERLDIHAEVVGRLGGLIQAQGRVLAGERLLAEGQVTLSGEIQ
jgi:3-hydroxyacyl-[acyl-carrier-protein] dehydratase